MSVVLFRAKLAQERDAHMKDKRERGQQEREKVEQFLEREREKEVLKEAVSALGCIHVQPYQCVL